MILYFENGYGAVRELAKVNTMAEANGCIKDFLDAYNYTSYYSRMWVKNGYVVIDVGSHTEFFKIFCETDEAAKAFIKTLEVRDGIR